jgi:hypothetical protein
VPALPIFTESFAHCFGSVHVVAADVTVLFICDRVFFVAFLVCCIHSDPVIFLLFFTFL